jgi:ABC-2 type transport system ATP-binding protein
MEEAERVASRIGVIDHGKIVAIGSPVELKQRTRKNTLEEAFLSLTGTAVRQDTDGGIDELRQHDRLWRAR